MSTAEINPAVAKPADSLPDKVAELDIKDAKPEEPAPAVAETLENSEKPPIAEAPAPGEDPKVENPPPSGPTLTPFPHPLPTAKPSATLALTADQQKKYDVLLAAVKEWKTIPLTSGAKAGDEAVTDADRLWLTRECLLRYLAATKWDEKAAENVSSQHSLGVASMACWVSRTTIFPRKMLLESKSYSDTTMKGGHACI